MPIRKMSLLAISSMLSFSAMAEVNCVLSSFDKAPIEQTLKLSPGECQKIDKKLLAYAKARSEARFKQEEEAKTKECENGNVECGIELTNLKNSHHWRLKSLNDPTYHHQVCMNSTQGKLGQKDGPEYKITVKTLDPKKQEVKSGSIDFKSLDKTSSLIDVTDMSLEVMEVQYYDPIVDETPAPVKRSITKDTSDMMITCHDDKVNLAINQSAGKKDISSQDIKTKTKSSASKK